MHLQQTKRGSRGSGGPQYYFHDLPEYVKVFLRKRGAVELALVTPYGATKSHYFAVSTAHKLDHNLRPVPGKVGHDRVQMGHAGESIGESIRRWYLLQDGDFERIDLDIDIRDDVFYITPLRCRYANSQREKEIARTQNSLTFTHGFKSEFWRAQLRSVEAKSPGIVDWSRQEICRVVADHLPRTRLAHIQEPDLLRASGPLRHLGMALGGYVGKGYDCFTTFQFLDYPEYAVPVEVKRHSQGFKYQQKKYGKAELSRAVILCAIHDHRQLPPHIDVVELDALCRGNI